MWRCIVFSVGQQCVMWHGPHIVSGPHPKVYREGLHVIEREIYDARTHGHLCSICICICILICCSQRSASWDQKRYFCWTLVCPSLLSFNSKIILLCSSFIWSLFVYSCSVWKVEACPPQTSGDPVLPASSGLIKYINLTRTKTIQIRKDISGFALTVLLPWQL